MTKKEFIKKLEESLSTNIPSSEVYSQINFYDDYIDNEIKKGRTEKDVLDELGDPSLIAKTIMQVNPTTNDDVYTENNTSYNHNNNQEDDNYYKNNNDNKNIYRRYYDRTGLGCALFGIIIFILILFLLRFLGFVVGSTFVFFSPFSIIFLVIILFNMFRGRNKQ